MRKKYIVEISEAYTFQVDNEITDCCYATIDGLEEKVLKMIDSDDIRSWIPIGTKEFIVKFNELYNNE